MSGFIYLWPSAEFRQIHPLAKWVELGQYIIKWKNYIQDQAQAWSEDTDEVHEQVLRPARLPP